MKNIKIVFLILFPFLFNMAYAYEIAVFYQPSDYGKNGCTTAPCENWLYEPVKYVMGFGQTQGTNGAFGGPAGYRVARVYGERKHFFNGSAQWLDVWNSTHVGFEIDQMKLAGVDHMIYLNPWERNNDPQYPGGFSGVRDELDTFVAKNQSRVASQQVKYSLMYASDRLYQGANYTNQADVFRVWDEKIKYAIDNHFNKPAYYFRSGKPMLTFWDTGTYMKRIGAAPYYVTMNTLISRANLQAQNAGYAGIFWVDSANTIVDSSLNNASGGNYTVQDHINYQAIIKAAGFNAGTGYHYHGVKNVYGPDLLFNSYNQQIQAYTAIWSGLIPAARNTAFKHFPVVSPGWDSRAMGEFLQPSPTLGAVPHHDRSRSCDGDFDSAHNAETNAWGCSLDNSLFATMLRKLKYIVDSNQDVTDQMIIVGTWNDIAEGTHILPTDGDKGAHSRILKNVFKPNNLAISVSFGKNGKYATKSYNAGDVVHCHWDTFGDPAPGVVKECLNQFGEKIADEGSSFTVTNLLQVKFGAQGQFVTAQLPLGLTFQCTYSAFGNDPAPGVAKACYDGSGNLLASEGQGFVVR